MFDDEKVVMAIQQIARIKHLELLMQIEKEGISITDKIDSHMPLLIASEAGYYLDDYACDTLERLLHQYRGEKNV
jgi:hypothetical protein